MATMALPIRELELSVCIETEKARAETECVVIYSRARAIRPSVRTTFKLGVTAAMLKFMFSSLARSQRKLISAYQEVNFTGLSDEEIVRMASSLDKIVEKERHVLALAKTLGRAQTWWAASLRELSEQVEHMASISESLRVEGDTEASTLLAMALDQFTAKEVQSYALQ